MTGPTILLVDDNPITRKLVCRALEHEGFAVVVAADGSSAVERFPRQPVSLVLQDLVLPDVDGFELVRRLRALPGGGDVPILAFSGLLSNLEGARLSAAGFDDLINKPVEPSRLIQIVRTHLPVALPVGEHFGKGRKLLVADDDAVQRKLVAFRLQKVGFEVLTAPDGLAALELARSSLPDAVVSDVLMPGMDGFRLCLELRRDERLRRVPVVLITNSYVEPADRELARKAGASDLILRTPDLVGLLKTLRASLGREPPQVEPVVDDDVERQRLQRVTQQLERHVVLNARMSRRCALLSAEIAVLEGISRALASQSDIGRALHHALAACFDAGGVTLGAVYVCEESELRLLRHVPADEERRAAVEGFFGELPLLRRVVSEQRPLALGAASDTTPAHRRLLEQAGVGSALVLPLSYDDEALGALLMMSRGSELCDDDHRVFGRAVAGQIGQALAVARAFAQKQASERLARERAQVLESILESIADGVVVAGDRGEVIHRNPAATRILGSAPGAWLEPDQVTPVAAEDVPLERAMRGESVSGREVYVRGAGGAEGTWLSISARPWRDDHGRVRGGVAALRDVTREKAAQSHLMASDRLASVGMLAAGVAHEINNPLSAVLVNLELTERLFEEQGQGGEIAEMLADAREAAQRVREIVRDLKVFSRHEDPRPGAVDVHRVLESSLRMARNEIRHRARVVLQLEAVPLVLGTESRLGQVFLNLVVNAAQAIEEGNVAANEIVVRTREVSGQVEIEVADTGCGIAQEAQQRLFTPFFTTRKAEGGTGLGLAICQRIVHGLGGDISVQSAVGAGTTVRVRLRPASPGPEPAAAIRPTPLSAAPRRGRVLVVDDDLLVRQMIGRALSPRHDVVLAAAAEEGLRHLRGGARFDVILCDLMMPQMTGADFHAELSRFAPDDADRVVFLTGGAFTAGARAFLDSVDNPRLEKPFDVRLLQAVVGERIR